MPAGSAAWPLNPRLADIVFFVPSGESWRSALRFRERLTYANVMATLAVFIALGGGANGCP